jgi:EmrB/QacA subfamily drug resistance transporter
LTDLFIVNVALPAMGRTFAGASLGDLSWVLNGYAIVFAALLVPAGRLADHYGRRRCFLAGVAVFTLGSAACAVAPGLTVLIAARVLQAVGAAMIVPTSLGLLLPAYPRRQHSLVVGIWAGVAAIAATSGAPLGGLLVEASWRWIFLVNVPIGIAALIGGRAVLPEIRAEHGARLPDGVSVAAVLAAITLVTLATVEGPQWGWTSAREVALYAAAAITTAVAVRRTLVHPHAVIEARLFASAEFSVATVAIFLFSAGFAAFLLVTVLLLQDDWGWSALAAGLGIAPGPAMAAMLAVSSGRIAARFGRRPAAIAGPLCMAAAAAWWLAVLPAHPDYVTGFLPGMLIGGIGAGLSTAPLLAAASTLPPDRATTGSAVLNMARQVGSALGVAITVVLVGTIVPGTLADFRRCWWFLIAAYAASSAVSAYGALRARRTRRPDAPPASLVPERAAG